MYLISIVASPTRLAWALMGFWLAWSCVRRLTVEADGRSDPLLPVLLARLDSEGSGGWKNWAPHMAGSVDRYLIEK